MSLFIVAAASGSLTKKGAFCGDDKTYLSYKVVCLFGFCFAFSDLNQNRNETLVAGILSSASFLFFFSAFLLLVTLF